MTKQVKADTDAWIEQVQEMRDSLVTAIRSRKPGDSTFNGYARTINTAVEAAIDCAIDEDTK